MTDKAKTEQDMREAVAREIHDYLSERFPDGALPGGVQLFADPGDHTDAAMKHEAGCEELANRILALITPAPVASQRKVSAFPLEGDPVEQMTGLNIEEANDPVEALRTLRGLTTARTLCVWADGTYRVMPTLDVPIARQEEGAIVAVIPMAEVGEPAPVAETAGEAVAWPETLDWSMVNSGAICHWRASFGDYVLDVVQGHDLIWSYRVNNTGRMNLDGLEGTTAAAMEDLRGRLSIRWAAAQKTMRLYAAPPPPQDDALRIAVEALEPFAAVLVDIGESEDDADCFRNPSRDYAKSQGISVGHVRRAAEALAALKSTAAQEGGEL